MTRYSEIEIISDKLIIDELSSTNNNAPNRIKPSSEPATGKKSRYADILAKLTKK